MKIKQRVVLGSLSLFVLGALTAPIQAGDVLYPSDEAPPVRTPYSDKFVNPVVVQIDTGPLLRGLTDLDSRVSFDVGLAAPLEGVVEQTIWHSPWKSVSRGRIAAPIAGEFTAVVNRDTTATLIALHDGRRFQVTYSGHADWHIVGQLDVGGFCPCGNSHDNDVHGHGKARGNVSPSGSTVIDVMIVYTAEARISLGGTVAMENLVDLAVEVSNAAYDSSSVGAQMRLVHTTEVAYTETGDSQLDLTRITGESDGFMDGVHALRTTYGADLVGLFADDIGAVCGRAWRPSAIAGLTADSGFSVTDIDCAAGNWTWCHEAGHNMGLGHAWSASAHVYPYSFGYTFVGSSGATHRTVMSVGGGSRFGRHSNPNVTWDGVAAGRPTGGPTPAYAALSLTNTASIIAAYLDAPPPECILEAVTDLVMQDEDRDRALAAARRFRDTVLHATEHGRALSKLYYASSSELKQMVFRNPKLAFDAFRLFELARPHMANALQNDGTVRVPTQVYNESLRMLAEVSKSASPSLQRSLDAVRVILRNSAEKTNGTVALDFRRGGDVRVSSNVSKDTFLIVDRTKQRVFEVGAVGLD